MPTKRKQRKPTDKQSKKYQPPVKLPLDFDQAVDGLLAVAPLKKGYKKAGKG